MRVSDLLNYQKIVAKVLSLVDITKLNGVETGATKNDTNAALRARSSHTGSQAISTITSLQTTLDAKAPLDNAALTGTPTAPTRTNGDASTSIATTAFVNATVQAIIGMAPADLDTLSEIAARLQSGESNYAALAGQIAGLLSKSSNLSDLTDIAAARNNLSLGTAATLSSTALRDRTTHTGSQAISTITSLQTALDARVLTSALAAVATSGAYGDLSGRPTLGTAAALNVGTVANSVAAGDDRRFTYDTINVQSGTTYTLQNSDTGKVVEFTNAAAVTVTVPSTLPVEFVCMISQIGAGQVTVVAGSGATLNAYPANATKTAGQFAELTVRIRAAGSAIVGGGIV